MDFKILGRQYSLSRESIIFIVPVALIFLGIIGLLINNNNDAVVFSTEGQSTSSIDAVPERNTTDTPDPSQETKQDEVIKVYVVGCVNNPGIVTLKKGQLIDDAITLAGGATEEADMDNINIVYKLKENVTLKILSKGSCQAEQGSSESEQSPSDSSDASAMEFVAEPGSGVVIDNSNVGQQKSGGKININTASVEQLDALPGIGPQTSKDIISFREKNGGFTAIEDIMNVTGIKDSKFTKIKDLITVD